MALNTYAQLKASVATWLNREEENLEDAIPDMIAMCEADLDRRLRAREMICFATATATDGVITLPSDFVEMKRLKANDRALEYLPQNLVPQARAITGDTTHYTITDNRLELLPAANTVDVTMAYYRQIPRLTSPLASNWLLEKYPDIYLYGALVHSAGFLREDSRIALWQAKYLEGVEGLNESASLSEQRGGILAMQY